MNPKGFVSPSDNMPKKIALLLPRPWIRTRGAGAVTVYAQRDIKIARNAYVSQKYGHLHFYFCVHTHTHTHTHTHRHSPSRTLPTTSHRNACIFSYSAMTSFSWQHVPLN